MVERRATGRTNFFSSSSVGTLPALAKLWFLLWIVVNVHAGDASSLSNLIAHRRSDFVYRPRLAQLGCVPEGTGLPKSASAVRNEPP
jgi:hypothetical protein